jgi:ABC-2 type transporter.
LKTKYVLIKNELYNYLKDPSIVILVFLPVVMSKLVTDAMEMVSQDVFLISMWIVFSQLMVGIMLSAPNIVQERETKTIDALVCTPLNLTDIIFSKIIAVLSLSLLSQIFVYVVNMGVPSNIFYILVPIVLGGLLFTLIGVVIGLIAKNSQNATAISSTVMIFLFLIVSVYETFPKFIYYIFSFIPSIVEVRLIDNIIDKSKILIPETVVMIIWISIFLIIITIIVKRKRKT